jgi:hypothetical protein
MKSEKETKMKNINQNTNTDVRYDYGAHKLVACNSSWYELQEELRYKRLESAFWKINPDFCGIPPLYYCPYGDPEELMIYKPSETEAGKGEYYWLRFRLHKWILEHGHYSYAFGGIMMGFFRYEEKFEFATVEAGLVAFLEATSGEAHECASEAVLRIELFKRYHSEDDDYDYYERGLVAEEPAYKPKKLFPWNKYRSSRN